MKIDMLKSKRSYFVSYSFQTKGSMLVHTKKKPVGLRELRAELAQRLKLPAVEIDNIILLDRRALTDEEKDSGSTVGDVQEDSKPTTESGSPPVSSDRQPSSAPTGGDL